ncbi:hypothetical protein NPIL_352701, partial [Nephila pilipes]
MPKHNDKETSLLNNLGSISKERLPLDASHNDFEKDYNGVDILVKLLATL